MADSTPISFTTGSAPGRPRQVGQVWLLASCFSSVEQPQNILVFVPSSTWTSRPMTGSYDASASSYPISSEVVVAVTISETSLSAQQDVVVAQALELPVEDRHTGDDGGGGHGGVDQPQGAGVAA